MVLPGYTNLKREITMSKVASYCLMKVLCEHTGFDSVHSHQQAFLIKQKPHRFLGILKDF